MKLLCILTLSLFVISGLSATPESHRKAAKDVITVISAPEDLTQSVSQALTPFLNQLKRKGMPDKLRTDVRRAFMAWIREDIVWEEMVPPMIDLYVEEFTEDELNQILAFYQTPVGRKMIKKFPTLFASGAKIGQDYAKSKQADLLQRIQPIISKYEAEMASQSQSQ